MNRRALWLCVLVALGLAAAAVAQKGRHLRGVYSVVPPKHQNSASILAQVSTGATIPMWSYSITAAKDGNAYTERRSRLRQRLLYPRLPRSDGGHRHANLRCRGFRRERRFHQYFRRQRDDARGRRMDGRSSGNECDPRLGRYRPGDRLPNESGSRRSPEWPGSRPGLSHDAEPRDLQHAGAGFLQLVFWRDAPGRRREVFEQRQIRRSFQGLPARRNKLKKLGYWLLGYQQPIANSRFFTISTSDFPHAGYSAPRRSSDRRTML